VKQKQFIHVTALPFVEIPDPMNEATVWIDWQRQTSVAIFSKIDVAVL
jgi:hypothetical protein